ncbi:unnamed protein product, partial [Larinioides sclopetarius]
MFTNNISTIICGFFCSQYLCVCLFFSLMDRSQFYFHLFIIQNISII